MVTFFEIYLFKNLIKKMYKQLKFGIRLLSLPTSFYLINEWNR
jgi:hypothetical protein